MFKIFITESILRRITPGRNEKPHADCSHLFSIMKKLKKIYVSSESSDISWTNTIKANHGLTIDFSKSDYIKNIPLHPETVLRNPSSIFVLDISIIEAEKIQKSYGVICLCNQNLYLNKLIDTNDEQTTSEGEPMGEGWPTVLRSVSSLPSNTLLLSDRYLFSCINPRFGEGFANVKSILDVLLPEKFLGEYHVIVIFDNENKHPSYSFDEIVTQLDSLKQKLRRDYPILMEVLGITPDCEIYTKFHNRRIVSNYYIIKVEHKLAAFNGNEGTSLQTITPQVLFTLDSLSNRSTPPLKSIDHVTAALRAFSNSASKYLDPSVYRYALNGTQVLKCMGIKNRILK